MPVHHRDIVSKVASNELMRAEEATKVVKVFKEQATRYIESCRGDVRANELTKILQDAVEAVKFRKVPEPVVSAQVIEEVSEPTAFVMERLFACVASVTPQGLKIIDPWTDDDIWGVADGGCKTEVATAAVIASNGVSMPKKR